MNQVKLNKQRRRRINQIRKKLNKTTSLSKRKLCYELIDALEKAIKQNKRRFRFW